MLDWFFYLNNKPMSKLTTGAVSVDAFSGTGNHINGCLSGSVPNQGPIPPGDYYIVDRPTGGRLGKIKDRFTGKRDWFALFADDDEIDDWTSWMLVDRGNFRLHPKGPRGISEGCVTIEKRVDFEKIRGILLNSKPEAIPSRQDLLAYGKLHVKSNCFAPSGPSAPDAISSGTLIAYGTRHVKSKI